ncbi:MAG: helix-turn-helix domain-containing protein [Treponema sp.]|nr:helix-turn-helix domain-containing protein [Treponema sp.]
MCFVCSGRSRNAFKILFQKISDTRDGFVFYDTGLSLLKGLSSCNSSDTLIMLDYDLYKGFSDFIFDFLRVKQLKIPMILIGNPLRDARNSPERWICENELQYDVQTLHTLQPLLKKISCQFETEEIQSLFKNICPVSENSPPTLLKTESEKINPVEMLRRSVDLPPSIFHIFSYFYKNRRREVSLIEIENLLALKSDSSVVRKNSAYSYISRLRKYMENSATCTFRLIRTQKGFYQLVPK